MTGESILGPTVTLRGVCRMTTQRSQRGLRLNKFLVAMRDPRERAAFAQDEKQCMDRHGLGEQEQRMVSQRDFTAMQEYGASNVAIGKAGAALGMTLVERGARGRGQTPAEFIAQRKLANRGQPWQF